MSRGLSTSPPPRATLVASTASGSLQGCRRTPSGAALRLRGPGPHGRPEGLKFKPGVHGIGALVATNLDNCGVHPNQVLQIVNVTDSLSILSFLQAPTSTDSAVVVKYKTYLGSLWVGGLLHHFSNYAVAW